MNDNSLILLFSIVCLFFGCSEEKDNILPSLSILNITEGEVVRNEITIQVDATDNEGISYVELKVDEVLIASSNQSPYELTWNTLSVEDGTHLIQCNAVDQEGNRLEKQVQVVVIILLFRL